LSNLWQSALFFYRSNNSNSIIMHHQSRPQKPTIAAKPKNIQKTNYVIIASDSHHHHRGGGGALPSKNLNNFNNETRTTEASPLFLQKIPLESGVSQQKDAFVLPSSPPNVGDCTNDCCGILNSKQVECLLRHKNGNGATDVQQQQQKNNGNKNHNNHQMDRNLQTTPSNSFDSSSSSSGGFKELDYVTKTIKAYEVYDREDKGNQQPAAAPAAIESEPTPIGHSKVQEIQSKLLAQQQQQQAKQHIMTANEHHTTIINRQPSSQYQKSTKELEKLLGARIEMRNKTPLSLNSEKSVKRLSKDFENSSDSQLAANISKQIQQKLQEEMKQQCHIIKDKFLIEKLPAQQHYREYMARRIPSSFVRPN